MSEKKEYSHLYSEILESSAGEKNKLLSTLARDERAWKKRCDEIIPKVQGKSLLLDNPDSKRALRKRKSIKPTVITKLPLIDKDALKSLSYAKLRILNNLWMGYVHDLLQVTQKGNLENALLRADYHGSILTVIQSKCPSLVGKRGIVVQETLNTFIMIQHDDKLLVIPKKGSVFECVADSPSLEACKNNSNNGASIKWHLYGDQMLQHSGLRSSKKFKSKGSVSL